MISPKRNVLLIWDRIGDYHLARWRYLDKHKSVDSTTIAQLGNKDELYGWQVSDNNIVSLSMKPVNKSDLIRRAVRLNRLLKDKGISHVFISGYGKIDYLLFAVISYLKGIKVYMFAESWYDKKKVLLYLKKVFIKRFISGLFVSGERARNHFVNEMGVGRLPVEMGYSAIDNDHFNVPDVKGNVILAVARYSEEKNLELLISAFRESEASMKYELILVGDGPQKTRLKELITGNKNITLLSWQDYNDLPTLYNRSKFLVLPSFFEPWGLVVNEGMAAGLPVILSSECGCLPDLDAHDGRFIFNPHSKNKLVEILNSICQINHEEYQTLSDQSKVKVSNYDLNSWSNKVVRLIDS